MFRKKKVNKLCLETLECRLAPAVSLMGDINTTPENSIPSKDIYPGSQGSMQQQPEKNQSTLNRLTNVGGTIFFTADTGANGQELWKSDGTAGGGLESVDGADHFGASCAHQAG